MRTEQQIQRGLEQVEDLLRAYVVREDSDPQVTAMLTLQAWTLEWVLGRREELETRFVTR